MEKHEQIISSYFKSWIDKDHTLLRRLFAPDAIYSESYGPEYHGIETIEQWFTDWQKHGTVLAWDIKQYVHQNRMTAVEWYFQCEYDGEISGFDGITLIEFDSEDRITNLKEFQSKLPHYFPYEKNI